MNLFLELHLKQGSTTPGFFLSQEIFTVQKPEKNVGYLDYLFLRLLNYFLCWSLVQQKNRRKTIESRLSFLTKKNRIEDKLTNRKSYFIKDQTFLNGSIQPNISDKSSQLSCKTSSDVKIIGKQIPENEISLLEDKITSLKENVSVLNTKITALR